MREELQTTRMLLKTGRLHRKLVIRLLLLAAIMLLACGAVVLDVVVRRLPLVPTFFALALGFLFGFFIMSKILAIKWDERQEVIMTGRLDVVGIIIFVAYVFVRVSASEYIAARYTDSFLISGYTLTFFFGIIVGRFIGIIKDIHQLSESDSIPRL